MKSIAFTGIVCAAACVCANSYTFAQSPPKGASKAPTGIKWTAISNNAKPTTVTGSPSIATQAVSGNNPKSVTAASPAAKQAAAKTSAAAAQLPKLLPTDIPNDTRMIVEATDAKSMVPYRYIGRIYTDKDPWQWGSGTLIGSRYVLSAAHVLVECDRKKGNDESIIFELPDGRKSKIVAGEADHFDKYGVPISSFDIAIASLAVDLGATGHAEWQVFDDSFIGHRVGLAGYDGDVAIQKNKVASPPLVARFGIVSEETFYRAAGGIVGLGAGGAAGDAFGLGAQQTGYIDGSKIKFYRNAAAVGGALGGAIAGERSGAIFDRDGWSSDLHCEEGASGAPIWVDINNRPMIIGVENNIGHVLKGPGRGARIAAGTCENMIRNFIQSH